MPNNKTKEVCKKQVLERYITSEFGKCDVIDVLVELYGKRSNEVIHNKPVIFNDYGKREKKC